MAIYPQAAATLLEQCRSYQDGALSLQTLKAGVWDAAQTITAIEESAMRDFLQEVEGRLDLIEHTTNRDHIFDQTLPVVAELTSHLSSYLDSDASGYRRQRARLLAESEEA